jgi:uncharacterized damage-inducible protein DinB
VILVVPILHHNRRLPPDAASVGAGVGPAEGHSGGSFACLRDTLAHSVAVEWLWLERVVTCTGTRGNTWTYPLWKFMMHLLNHQSYHRGQVTHMLRQLGIKPPAVDYLFGLDAGLRPAGR